MSVTNDPAERRSYQDLLNRGNEFLYGRLQGRRTIRADRFNKFRLRFSRIW